MGMIAISHLSIYRRCIVSTPIRLFRSRWVRLRLTIWYWLVMGKPINLWSSISRQPQARSIRLWVNVFAWHSTTKTKLQSQRNLHSLRPKFDVDFWARIPHAPSKWRGVLFGEEGVLELSIFCWIAWYFGGSENFCTFDLDKSAMRKPQAERYVAVPCAEALSDDR